MSKKAIALISGGLDSLLAAKIIMEQDIEVLGLAFVMSVASTDTENTAGMIREASLAIAVCGDLALQKHEGYWIQDCSAATQNILLAAHALGLGAVWLGVHPCEDRVESTRKLFSLPENVLPLCLIAVGYPAE